ncbi:bifunctional phosphoribosylaminoimidazolecarboxamide formyltransferase/IMP cyclohydrolase [Acidithiobacillus sp. IBUN Pt1247-S3]|uniref:bifunctional phosphoribosylaminoimidazolecarboxamide formyltransferase/IMP cyclohydrolase n=1 Tax=Acidithiobacillus sp. IBUN Pt1247-S3 TaxID=3166642 RepID=UPI0034E3BF24
MGGITRALISVSDKQGVVEFARGLSAHGVELLSTGGTARLLREAGLAVIEVADYTGFPEMLEGRLKTLHPKIHGGLLARRDDPQQEEDMRRAGIPPIDLLCVNLYPFAATIAQPDVTLDEAIEQIDIGGPTMLRAGAKNWQGVTVVVDPADYELVLQEMEQSHGGVGAKLRYRLAAKVFAHTARYDGLIADHLSRHLDDLEKPDDFPQIITLQLEQRQNLRYGENPHQRAAFYADASGTGLAHAKQLQGKELSYNNLGDSDAAINLVLEFAEPACAIIKHGNPCGTAIGRDAADAFARAWSADPVSAFGSVIACNRVIDAGLAQAITESFIEVILAPEIAPEAAAILARKKNLRVLAYGAPESWRQAGAWDFKRVRGGLLLQDFDDLVEDEGQWRVVSERSPSAEEQRDLRFAWKVAKHVRSNAIVYAADGRTLGVGAGQMSRVDAARCGATKAEELGFSLQGAALASDAFFPFRDGVDAAGTAGVKAIIQPGGSIRDEEVIASANEHGIAMIFTSVRHFRHG